jgi:serine/threonine protein kinase
MTTPAAAGGDGAAAAGGGSENCLPIGTRLSDFEITGVLGEGGFGIVYIAYDHSLHRTVAIKEYMPVALAMRGGDNGVSLRAERQHETHMLD